MIPGTRTALASVAAGVLVVGGVLTTAAMHQLHAGARAVAASDAAAAQGDLALAIDFAHDAAEAELPGSPYPEQGAARLVSIAHAAEGRGDDATAVAAWTALRAATLATRRVSGASPYFAAANQAIARIAWRARSGAARSGDADEQQRAIVEPLARDEGPSTVTLLLLGSGMAVFLASVARLALLPAGSAGTGAGQNGRRSGKLARWGLCALAGLAMTLFAYLRG